MHLALCLTEAVRSIESTTDFDPYKPLLKIGWIVSPAAYIGVISRILKNI